MTQICIIAAVGRNHVIGYEQGLPWNIPEDLAYFMRTTQGHPCVMGRKTYDSIGRALPGRPCYVVSATLESLPDATVVRSLAQAVDAIKASGAERLFVVGGAKIYKEALPLADLLYLTVIQRDYRGDTWFPQLSKNDWVLDSKALQVQKPNGLDPLRYSFNVYRKPNAAGQITTTHPSKPSRVCTARSGMSYVC